MSQKVIPITDAQEPLGGISKMTLYELINDGTLKTLKIGRRRYTTDKFVQECIDTLVARTAGGGKKRGAA